MDIATIRKKRVMKQIASLSDENILIQIETLLSTVSKDKTEPTLDQLLQGMSRSNRHEEQILGSVGKEQFWNEE